MGGKWSSNKDTTVKIVDKTPLVEKKMLVYEAEFRDIQRESIDHPLEKLESNLKKHDSTSKKTKVVLVSTGAYCPIHKMHLHVFHVAKKHLEENYNYSVLAGFVSPSHDYYIFRKLQQGGFIPSDHRLKMVDLAINEDPNSKDWLVADPWESSQPLFISFYTVIQHLDEVLAEKFPNEQIEVMFLCGADLVLRSGGLNKLGKHSVVAVGRSGWSERVKELDSKDLIFIAEDTEDISSTKIREKVASGEDLTEMTYHSVQEYLRTEQLVKQ